jgi:LmbE family N-acetylglucosaminyl deacetylase
MKGHRRSKMMSGKPYPLARGLAFLCSFWCFAVPKALCYDWQPYPDKCALMVIHAHADDEAVFFGGSIPYYSVVRKLPVVDVMTTISSTSLRANELRDACWTYGLRYEPVFLQFSDCCGEGTLDDAWAAWGGKDNVVGAMVQQIRRFKPDVVLTHDFGGEYGHPNHMGAGIAAAEACKAAGDGSKYADAGAPWEVKKCYVHLLPNNRFFHYWDTPFDALGGKTARQVANEGLLKHASQGAWATAGIDENSRFWGLYYTSVGPDIIAENDFFENIDISGYAGAAANPYAPPGSDKTAPPVPSGLRVVSIYGTMIELAWDSVVDDAVGVSKYLFYRDGGEQVCHEAFHFENFALIEGLDPAATCRFSVSARDYRLNESAASAPVTASTIDFDGLLIARTETAPSIDGAAEELWEKALAVNLGRKLSEGANDGSADCSGTLRALWDQTALYLMVQARDELLRSDSPSEPWLDDAVEIYLDLGNQKSAGLDNDDNHIVCPWSGAAAATQVPLKSGTVTFKIRETDNGYDCEIAVPWAAIGSFSAGEGKKIGFDLALDDDDDGGGRDALISWWGNERNFTSPSLWGTGKLVLESPVEIMTTYKLSGKNTNTSSDVGPALRFALECYALDGRRVDGFQYGAQTGTSVLITTGVSSRTTGCKPFIILHR